MRSPVLFLIFNRPDVTREAFQAIRDARPPRLYVAGDGPRADRAGEAEQCRHTREIATQVDWPCELKTMFRRRNLGCAMGVSTAINWFFQNEPEGIILEDDLVAHPDFFAFCDSMLEKYRYDERIMHICGENYQFGFKRGNGSYYFSNIMHCCGWASWARAWKKFDFELSGLQSVLARRLPAIMPPENVRAFQKIFLKVKTGEINSWAYRWSYSIWKNSGVCVQSNVNMIKNIGYAFNATHTSVGSIYAHTPVEPMGEIVHTETDEINKEADAQIYRLNFNPRPEFDKYFEEVVSRMEREQYNEARYLLDVMSKCYGEMLPLVQAGMLLGLYSGRSGDLLEASARLAKLMPQAPGTAMLAKLVKLCLGNTASPRAHAAVNMHFSDYEALAATLVDGPIPETLSVTFDELLHPLDENSHLRVALSLHLLERSGMKRTAANGCDMTFSR